MSSALLVALTEPGKLALDGADYAIKEFPYRVGRESRKYDTPEKKALFAGLRLSAKSDLYLVEESELINVSREHFQIDRGEGGYVLQDRGSTLGTIVEGRTVGGGNAGGRVVLRDGDVIIVGSPTSPYVFKFRIGK